MFAGKKSAQIREILISESAWEEMTCLFAPSLNFSSKDLTNSYMNGMGKKEYSSYLGTPNNTYLKYNPKAKGNGVTIIRQGSN
ncbi:TPA: hypothetical protein J0585_003671 [Escherichia coli]|nr:hypothetical protein [Escherichia coli]